MTAPTSIALALMRSTLPARRVAGSTSTPSNFALLLKNASAKKTPVALANVPVFHAANAANVETEFVPGSPMPMARSEILKNADQLMGIPYVWGGTSPSGLDCSAFLSKVWGVARHTTDTLASVSHPITKDELQPGDALNLITARDPEGDGHVRLFERWADAAHTKMYVYEETPPRSVHHVIDWDPHYQPMRRANVIDA